MIRRMLFHLLVASVFWGGIAVADEPMAITVWPFDSDVLGHEAHTDERLLAQEIFPDLLGAELSVSPRLRLVERQRLDDVFNEQKLGASELADDATRLRLGRLVGARWMVFGSYLRIGDSWQINVRVVDVESSRILATSAESGQKAEYANAVRRVAAQILRDLP
jgi:hypothetical protein